jgi:hypothetical protein
MEPEDSMPNSQELSTCSYLLFANRFWCYILLSANWRRWYYIPILANCCWYYCPLLLVSHNFIMGYTLSTLLLQSHPCPPFHHSPDPCNKDSQISNEFPTPFKCKVSVLCSEELVTRSYTGRKKLSPRSRSPFYQLRGEEFLRKPILMNCYHVKYNVSSLFLHSRFQSCFLTYLRIVSA